MELGDLKGTDALWGGVLALPIILWKVYQSMKSDLKGDSLDGRIQSFNQQLQAQLERTVARMDSLQAEKFALESENASLKATVTLLTAENQRLNTNPRAAQPATQGS